MKLFKNKKILTVLALVLVLSITAGTYAWFVISSDANTAVIDIGDLDMETTFATNAPQGYQFEPGSTVKVDSSIKNTGSLSMTTKLEINAESRLIRDENGDRYANPNYVRVIEDDENVVYGLDESKLGFGFMPDGSLYAWLYNMDVEGEYYLTLEQGAGFALDYLVELDGPAMTNEYMNATIQFENQWVATQALPRAVEDRWNVDFSRLDMVPNFIDASSGLGRSAASAPITVAEAYERLFGIPYEG